MLLSPAHPSPPLAQGLNVIVSTSTSSGKSLIYQVPIVRALEEDLNSTAMFIFPTKALAQDQKRSLEDLICAHEGLSEQNVMVSTYDGDTDKVSPGEPAFQRTPAEVVAPSHRSYASTSEIGEHDRASAPSSQLLIVAHTSHAEPTSFSRTRTCCTNRSCPTSTIGVASFAPCASSSSMSCTRTTASLAHTSPSS